MSEKLLKAKGAAYDEVCEDFDKIKAQRDALLAAAKVVAPFLVAMEHPSSQDLLRAIDNCKEAQP